jgi:hypothetical protein
VAGDTLPNTGYVASGTRFNNVSVATGNYLGYVCTTSGYTYKESYNAAHAYKVGDCVKGSDTKIYICILDDSGSASHAPTTGGSYATYWALLGTTEAVFKQYGKIL